MPLAAGRLPCGRWAYERGSLWWIALAEPPSSEPAGELAEPRSSEPAGDLAEPPSSEPAGELAEPPSSEPAGELEPRSPEAAAASPARWAEASPAQATELSRVMGCPVHEVEERLERGARCFTASIDGRPAAYGWVSPGAERIGELERKINLGPEEAYIWNCVTLREHRRKGLYSGLLLLMVATLSQDGFQRLWIGAALSNRPSIRGFEKAGFRPALRVVYFRLGSQSWLYTRRFPGAPAEMAEDAVRALAAPEERRWGPLLVRRLCSSRQESCSGVGG